jgi:L-malate glycosyltransferase
MRYVLIGDGDSPHLLKWARALRATPGLELWAVSSRGFAAGFDEVIAPQRRLALLTTPRAAGGNAALLRCLPRLVHWLHQVQPDWIHAHYLSSHGTLAWLAQRFGGVRGRLIGSAWGSDILVAPERSVRMRWLTRRVLRHCTLATSDSAHMAQRMHALGAGEVMVFPFGLEALPALPAHKEPWLFYANRGLEPVYAPQRVLQLFANVAATQPEARLVVANDGSLRAELENQARALKIQDRVQFVGRLDAHKQAWHYARSQWYLSLPTSDSVAVSVLEAMAQGCIPILSDLPANHELVRSGDNGLIVAAAASIDATALATLHTRAADIARQNRTWVEAHALFAPAVQRFMARVVALS